MKCPRCGEPEHPDQCTVPAPAGGLRLSNGAMAVLIGEAESPTEWRCFHCDEVFDTHKDAAKHFGTRTFDPTVCVIDAGEVSELRADRDYAESQIKEMTRQRDKLRSRVHALRSKYEADILHEESMQILIDQAQELNMGYGDGCPVCYGDCSSANPPVIGCPMKQLD